ERRHRRYSAALKRSSYRLLEIGCGGAGVAAPFTDLGVDYHGIDIDSRPVDRARARGIANLVVGDFMDHPLDGRYDVIFLTQVLEHITDPTAFVDRVSTALTIGGVLHLDVPNQ